MSELAHDALGRTVAFYLLKRSFPTVNPASGRNVGGQCLSGFMPTATALEGLTEDQLLAHAETVARTHREAEAETLRIAVQHAVLNNPDRLDLEQAKLPGREQAKQFGGMGTPEVLEFAPAVLGARLQISSGAAHSLLADALDIAHRLPRLWRRVEALEVKASYARFVARKTRDLGVEQAAAVDKRVHTAADGRIPWSRFEALVEGAIAASDPEAAADRERDAAMRQLAKPTRSAESGMRGFYVRAPLHVIARLDAMVTRLSRILLELGDPGNDDERRLAAPLRRPRRARGGPHGEEARDRLGVPHADGASLSARLRRPC